MFHILLLLPLFTNCAFAGVFVDGPCPNVKPVQDFNMSAFHRGRWYEIARYSNEFEKRGDCVTGDHFYENGLKIVNFTELVDNKYFDSFYIHIDTNPNAGNAGIIDYFSRNMTAPEGIKTEAMTFTYLDIDYDSYAIIYRCVYDEKIKKRHDYSWIISRKKKLDSDVKAKIENFIKSTGFLNIDQYLWNHFELDLCNV